MKPGPKPKPLPSEIVEDYRRGLGVKRLAAKYHVKKERIRKALAGLERHADPAKGYSKPAWQVFIVKCACCGTLIRLNAKSAIRQFHFCSDECKTTNHKEAKRAWHRRNRTYECLYNRMRRKLHPIEVKVRRALAEELKRYSQLGRCYNQYGINFKAICDHIGPKPGPDYHIDHIIPLSSFDLSDPAQLLSACAPNNHRWLPAAENLSKGATYDEDRRNALLESIKQKQLPLLWVTPTSGTPYGGALAAC